MAKSQKKGLHRICVKLEKILSDLLELNSGEIIKQVLYKTKASNDGINSKKKSGRKPKLSDKQLQRLQKMVNSNKFKTKDIADKFGISVAMVYRHLKKLAK